MMARSTECQTAFGYGRCNSSNSIAPGTMNSKGMFWGSNDKTSGVKVFGMENVWGNLWRRTAGWINANGTQKVKLTRGTHWLLYTSDVYKRQSVNSSFRLAQQ